MLLSLSLEGRDGEGFKNRWGRWDKTANKASIKTAGATTRNDL